MTGILVLIVVMVLLTTRTRRARKRWRKSLGWCWAVLLWMVLPRPSMTHGRPSAVRPGTSAPPAVLRPVRASRKSPWPSAPWAPPRYSPSDERPGQGPRYFSYEQKQELLLRAGYQCERVTGGIRCHRTTQLRADHKHPYSWGGKTILENGQILCDPHNVEKGAYFTDVTDPAEQELVCVEHMLLRNRFGSGRPRNRREKV